MIKEKGCVYFFRHIGLSPVKIGYSNNKSPLDRFNQFKTYAPYGSEILGFIQTDEAKKIETFLHRKFSSFRLDGEWFEINEEQVIKEVDFYSSKEDVKERNDFQIAWAKSLLEDKKETKEIKEIKDSGKNTNYYIFKEKYLSGQKMNMTKLSNELKVSRQTLYYWRKIINKTTKK